MSTTNLGIVPIFDPDRGYREWLLPEIYTGPSGTGRIVPNVDDKIWDWESGKPKRVTEVDYSTGLSKWINYVAPSVPEDIETDYLRGTGPGHRTESWRLLYDDSVVPHVIAPDARLFVFATTVTYAKIFLGTDISQATGKVISKIYDASGTLVSENIPLEIVAMNDIRNFAIKALKPGYTTERLKTGDEVTVAVYDDENRVRSWATLIVNETSFIRGIEANQKYVKSIELISPWKSSTDPFLLEIPENVNMQSVGLMARVNYSDGTGSTLAVNNHKFSLSGIETIIATEMGRRYPIVLNYLLDKTESAVGAVAPHEKYLTQSYTAKITDVDGAYSVKLFAYPCWNETTLEYELHFYLYNLDRSTWYRVDHLIELDATSTPFNGRKYGVTQEVAFVIDLSAVDSRFAKYRHTQKLTVSLFVSGDKTGRTLWSITHEPLHIFPYGVEVYAMLEHISGGNYKGRLDGEYKDKALWLERFYYDTFPVSNPDIEFRPPAPTHFVIDANGVTREYPIASWNQDLLISTTVKSGQNLYLHWILRNGETDLHLGVSGITVRYPDTPADV